jgi:hypothetical protein
MRYVYRVKHDLSIWFFEPAIDERVIAEIMKILRGPDLRQRALRWFLDLSLVERIDIDFNRISDFARFDRSTLDPKVAVRAAALVSTPLAFGVVRMYQTLMSDTNLDLRIFHQRSECANFLGVPQDALTPAEGAEQTA